jgi:tagaturonate reductase
MRLARKNISSLDRRIIDVPDEKLFHLPEKILQFGTGVLLRGLCDYIVHQANKRGLFNGRIVVVKSTDAGDTKAFEEQDNLYTVCVRGVDQGRIVQENIICSSISRVLSAKKQWNEILEMAGDPDLRVIISNTTEVGLQLVKESINEGVPSSFPAKLLAVLYRRFQKMGNSKGSEIVVIPTELVSNNGKVLLSIVNELSEFNGLATNFRSWLDERITFCNSLVDRIVTKDPGEKLLENIQAQLGYSDELLTMCEDYYLWAIEGDRHVADILSFAADGEGVFVKPDIDIYKFLKLHLLNGTHTLSAPLAYLSGFEMVKDGTGDPTFFSYIRNLMTTDIARAIPYAISDPEIQSFCAKVLDRFSNPYLQHRWINITLQNTMKMKMRNVPVLLRYRELYGKAPRFMAIGFAAYLLFMKAVKKDDDKYFGRRNDEYYPINDDRAGYFYQLWKEFDSSLEIVDIFLANRQLWGEDLSEFVPFANAVKENLASMLNNGVRHTISSI